jgi:hypothetical protein
VDEALTGQALDGKLTVEWNTGLLTKAPVMNSVYLAEKMSRS